MSAIGNLTYLGVPPWQETVGSELEDDKYGIDTLTRPFEVRPDKLAEFRAAYKKGTQDVTFPWMYVVSVRISEVANVLPKASVIFKGALLEDSNVNPKLPRNLFVNGGIAQQQVSLTSLTLPDAVRNVTYQAPFTEWHYITTIDPKVLTPAFPGILNVQKPQAIIKTSNGAIGQVSINNDVILPPGSAPGLPTGEFVGLLKVNNSKFDYTQMGNVWMIIERNELLVVDYFTALINFSSGNKW